MILKFRNPANCAIARSSPTVNAARQDCGAERRVCVGGRRDFGDAGRGATVGKWRGREHAVAGGIGLAVGRSDDANVVALAVGTGAAARRGGEEGDRALVLGSLIFPILLTYRFLLFFVTLYTMHA